MLATSAVLPPSDAVRRIGFLLIPGFPLMSYASAVEPLRAANTLSGRALYAWHHLTIDGEAVESSAGTRIEPDFDLARAGRLDALFVCAGGNPATFDHTPTLARLRALATAGLAIGGMSGGAYVLARAGLLAAHRCTIHWEHIPALVEEFPNLRLARTLYVFDRARITCAGGLAAFDMMLELIARHHGAPLATAVAEWYLHTRTRSGNDAQRVSLRERYRTPNERVLKVLALMEKRIETPLTRTALARAAGVTLRQLERLFAAHLGTTLHDQYLTIRLDRARKLLRQTSLSIAEVAVASGFVSSGHFSRLFRQRFGHAPSIERGRDAAA